MNREMHALPWEVREEGALFSKQPVSITILVLNLGMFLLQLNDPNGNMLIDAAFVPSSFFAGRNLWTIITSMFMHANFFHIFFNMLSFYFIAADVESALKRGFFLFTYLISGISAVILHSLIALLIPDALNIPLLGASGAIVGILAAYCILFPKRRFYVRIVALVFPVNAENYIIVYLILQFFFGLLFWGTSPVAYFAHIGGLFTGVACALLYKFLKGEPEPAYHYRVSY
jgi:membrane associated rhomboid family serine protease